MTNPKHVAALTLLRSLLADIEAGRVEVLKLNAGEEEGFEALAVEWAPTGQAVPGAAYDPDDAPGNASGIAPTPRCDACGSPRVVSFAGGTACSDCGADAR